MKLGQALTLTFSIFMLGHSSSGYAQEAFPRARIIPSNPHTLAATACTGLDHYRIADLIRNLDRLFSIGNQAHMAWNS